MINVRHTRTRTSLSRFPSNLWSQTRVTVAQNNEISLRREIRNTSSPLYPPSRSFATLPPLRLLKEVDASAPFSSLLLHLLAALPFIARLTHLRRPQSGQINNAGGSIPPATPVIGWKCGCCSARPVSLRNQIARTQSDNPNTHVEAADAAGMCLQLTCEAGFTSLS